MTLTEFQLQTLKATDQEYFIDKLDANPILADTLLPRTPYAQGLRHEKAGLSQSIDLINMIAQGAIEEANAYLDQLRTQVAQSTRGVAKDALPILQALGLIEEIFIGDISIPQDFNVFGVLEELNRRNYIASAEYQREQFPNSD